MARAKTSGDGAYGSGFDDDAATAGTAMDPSLKGDLGVMVPDSWDDIVAAMEEQGVEVIEFEGSPWDVVPKKELVGQPFMVAGIHFSEGKFGQMVSVRALLQPDPTTKVSKKIVFNDGSSGVYLQFRELVDKTKQVAGFICRKGLRASEYTYIDETKAEDDPARETPAVTYYVA